jgi:hypothetical protein
VLLRQRGFQEGKLRRLRAVLDHHADRTPGGHPSTAALVLAAAEDYSTAVRLFGARTLRSSVLGAMAASDRHHAAVVQLLVNALGAFPPGTLVQLADGRRARVAVPARGEDLWDRPLLRVVEPATGELVDSARGVDFRAVPG